MTKKPVSETKDSRRKSVSKSIYRILFTSYSVLLIWELFLGRYRSFGGPRRYNLTPLKTIIGYLEHFESFGAKIVAINLAGNVLAFLPLGFFLPIVFKRISGMLSAVIVTILTSITAEVIQFALNVGGFDVDDILLNTLGGAIGFLLYKIAYRRRINLHLK